MTTTPILTVLEEDRHAWFAGRTRAIIKYLDAEMPTQSAGDEHLVLDVGGAQGTWRIIWLIMVM